MIEIDVDDHALSLCFMDFGTEKVRILASKAFPALGLQSWKTCLLDAIADTCVHHSRRDPRDCGSAEQMLYDQLDDVLELTCKDQMVEVVIRSTSWCQNLILQPQQVRLFCDAILQDALEEVRAAVTEASDGFPESLLMTASASRLPGLVAGLQGEMPEQAAVVVLSPDAASRGAHSLATRFQRRDLPQEHLQGALLLAAPGKADSGAFNAKRVISMI